MRQFLLNIGLSAAWAALMGAFDATTLAAGYAVGAPDVITIGRIASGAIASPSDFQRYHADLDGNGAVTDYDVWLGLRKWVDDRLPPSLVAAPRRATAVPGAPATVLLGNAGNGAPEAGDDEDVHDADYEVVDEGEDE